MIRQLSIAFTFLLSMGFLLNSCDDSKPTFNNPDPLDTGSSSLIPDSLAPEPPDTTEDDPEDTVNQDRIKLAVPVRYDSMRDGGSTKEIWLEGPTVEIHSGTSAGELLVQRDCEVVDNPPSGFEASTNYGNETDAFAVFSNESEVILGGGQAYTIVIDEFEYEGATLATEQTINIRAEQGWVQKIAKVEEQ